MSRNDQKKLARHREIAELLETEPLYVITRALLNVQRKRESAEDEERAALERWNALLRTHDIAGLRAALLGDDRDSRALRNAAVFGGVLGKDAGDRSAG